MNYFVAKKYAAYIEALETELQRADAPHSIQDKAQLHLNIAAAQFELGLNRKCLKYCAQSLQLVPGKRNARSMLLQGKAMVASGKTSEAIAVWELLIVDDDPHDALLTDVGVMTEAMELLEKHRPAVQSAVQPPIAVDSQTTSNSSDCIVAAGQRGEANLNTAVEVHRPAAKVSDAVADLSPPRQAVLDDGSLLIPTSRRENVTSSTALKDSVEQTVRRDIGSETKRAAIATKISTEQNACSVDSDAIGSTSTCATANEVKDEEDPSKALKREALLQFHKLNIGITDKHVIKPYFLTAMRSNLPHICGEELVDDLVCLAYININSGHYEFAMKVFELLSTYRDNVPSAHIGLGSIHALQSRFDQAIEHFSRSIELAPSIADAWKRRGQTRAASGQLSVAVDDLSKAAELEPDSDVFYQRALVYHQSRNYLRALHDFTTARKKGLCNATIMNYTGMCEGQVGLSHESLVSHALAVGLDLFFKEAYLNIALMCKELGNYEEAEQAFAAAITVASFQRPVEIEDDDKRASAIMQQFDMTSKNVVASKQAPSFAVITCIESMKKVQSRAKQKTNTALPFLQAHSHRGLMYYAMGKPGAALRDFNIVVNALYAPILRATSSENSGTSENASGFVGEGLSLPPAYAAERTEKANGAGVTLSKRTELIQDLIKAAMCCQSLGQCHKAVGFLDRVLAIAPTHNCWFMREIILAIWHLLDVSIDSFSLDSKIDPRLKDGWCKQVPWQPYMNDVYQLQKHQQKHKSTQKLANSSTVASASKYPLAVKPIDIPPVQRCRHIPFTDADGDLFAPVANKSNAGTRNAGSGWNREPEKIHLVLMSNSLSRFIQINSSGFLPNRRQQRMFGLAVLQMTISLKKHFELIGMEVIGLAVPDAASSRLSHASSSNACTASSVKSFDSSGSGGRTATPSSALSGAPSSSSSVKRGASTHPLGWRDMFDIVVRWRQVSEPADPVWWIDRFPVKSFQEGFGLQTPLINGQLKTVRYGPYFAPAFQRLKDLLISDGFYTANDRHMTLDVKVKQRLKKAKSLSEIYSLVSAGDFYVVIPCPSVDALHNAARFKKEEASAKVPVLMGTRLTLVSKMPEGYEFTIRTPGTPPRWNQYASELDKSFHRMEELFISMRKCDAVDEGTSIKSETSADAFGSRNDDERILCCALELFYLWVTFAPLSRGTAACGYAGLFATVLSFGRLLIPAQIVGDADAERNWVANMYSGIRGARPEVDEANIAGKTGFLATGQGVSLWPEGRQLDWEAILAKDFDSFFSLTKSWFDLRDVTLLPSPLPLRKVLLEAGSEYRTDVKKGLREEAYPRPPQGSNVCDCIKTMRDMYEVLALPY